MQNIGAKHFETTLYLGEGLKVKAVSDLTDAERDVMDASTEEYDPVNVNNKEDELVNEGDLEILGDKVPTLEPTEIHTTILKTNCEAKLPKPPVSGILIQSTGPSPAEWFGEKWEKGWRLLFEKKLKQLCNHFMGHGEKRNFDRCIQVLRSSKFVRGSPPVENWIMKASHKIYAINFPQEYLMLRCDGGLVDSINPEWIDIPCVDAKGSSKKLKRLRRITNGMNLLRIFCKHLGFPFVVSGFCGSIIVIHRR